ncbi:mannan endo-1,4-beta-mannosidase-like isoform X2 [Babylonia areolata]
MRTWVHVDGSTSPRFDRHGYVTGLDKDGTFLTDFRRYLDDARARNILVFPTLWNGAVVNQQNKSLLEGLITSPAKLDSYLDHALTPWVRAVRGHPALGGWDIINELEGVIIPGRSSAEPCYDTRFLRGSTAGFAGSLYRAEDLLRFINWQADAIRRADPQALVTAGSWRQWSQSDAFGGRNLYTDHCLVTAGRRARGTLTFYSTHVYSVLELFFWPDAAFLHEMEDYRLDKPLVLAEFSQVGGAGWTITDQFLWAYQKGYSGAWSWQAVGTGSGSDSLETQVRGINTLKNCDNQTEGGRVPIDIRTRHPVSGDVFCIWRLLCWALAWFC